MVSDEKSAVTLIGDPLFVIRLFSLDVFSILFVFGFWQFLSNVSWCSSLKSLSFLHSLSFLDVYVHVFHQIWEGFSYFSFKYFFYPSLPFLSFWDRHPQSTPPNKSRITFFSSAHGKFSKVDWIWVHKPNLNKFYKTEIIQCMFFIHNGIKLEISNRKISKKSSDMLKLNSPKEWGHCTPSEELLLWPQRCWWGEGACESLSHCWWEWKQGSHLEDTLVVSYHVKHTPCIWLSNNSTSLFTPVPYRAPTFLGNTHLNPWKTWEWLQTSLLSLAFRVSILSGGLQPIFKQLSWIILTTFMVLGVKVYNFWW